MTSPNSAAGARLRRLVEHASDEAVRSRKTPQDALRLILGDHVQNMAAVQAPTGEGCLVMQFDGHWFGMWVATTNFHGTFGWESWSVYVRKRHLAQMLRDVLGPMDSAQGIAVALSENAHRDKVEYLMAAALSQSLPEDRDAAAFLIAMMGIRISEQAQNAPVHQVRPTSG